MLKMRNFKCSETGEVFERFVEDGVVFSICKCGGAVTKQLSAPRCFGNTTGRSPSTSYKR